MNSKKIIAPILATLTLLFMAGCTYDPYLLTQKDSLSTEIFVIPGPSGAYVVKTKDGNIWYYNVNAESGEMLKYVIFGSVTSNTFSATPVVSQTNTVELEKPQ